MKTKFSIFAADRITSETPPLEFNSAFSASEELKKYLTCYSLPLTPEYRAGYVDSGKYRIFVQYFSHARENPHVYFLHGYLDHSGLGFHLVNALVDAGYTVITLDLPGHGLSTGKEADIDSFSHYREVLHDIIDATKDTVSGKRTILCHSTGCAAAMDYCNHYRNDDTAYYFIAPLVRSYRWHLSKAGIPVASLFTDTMPRRKGGATSDDAMNELKKSEPFSIDHFPLHWVEELIKWNKTVESIKPCKARLVIFQGTEDTVVDWRYNVEFLQNKFTNSKVYMIQNSLHCIHYERDELRSPFFSQLLDEMNGQER